MNRFKSVRYTHIFLCVVWILLSVFSSSSPANAQTKKKAAAAGNELVLSVADFGANGDGVTDDGPAFQSALDALAEAGGGTLFVPGGRYFIASPIIKDFSGSNASITIQGVPSDTMPAPPTATGDQLSLTLDLVSEIIPATGSVDSAFTLSNLHDLTVEHLAFTGRESEITDAYVTLNFSDITSATIYHCEFYGISTFGLVAGEGGGNVIRAARSDLTIQQSSVLGSTANSGAYAGVVENVDWKGFTISNSIFLDYGQGAFYGKMGLGAPLSWINFGDQADKTPESPRREIVVKDTFLDEGGWIGITAYPQRWDPPFEIDLLYISGLKMNVSNFGTAGNQFYDVKNVLIENSHYGWSHNTGAAVDIYRSEHAILDQLTCIASADRIRADARTDRLTVINSEFEGLDSLAQNTTTLETPPEEDPVQYVRQQFLAILGRQPDPAAHFYWSDLLLQCGSNENCLETTRSDLSAYLKNKPENQFSLAGTVIDEEGNPIAGATLNLTGSQSLNALTDAAGNFRFSNLATSGVYTVTGSKTHYTFTTSAQSFVNPAHDVNVSLGARLNRHSITGRIINANGTGISGVKVQLLETSAVATTNSNGEYSFADLAAGGNYTIRPSSEDAAFLPANATIVDLGADVSANFRLALLPVVMKIQDSENALVLESVNFVNEPISVFESLGFSPDGISRAVFFVTNLEGFNDRSQFSLSAEDSEGKTYPLDIEFISDVPQQSWLKQLNFKLSPELRGKCVDVKLSVGELISKSARLCVANN
jgi:hypothetical protein